MANLRGRKARNAGSGAFALGFTDKMKSVAAAAAVLMLATTGTVVVQAQVSIPAASAQTPGTQTQIIEADAIASGLVKDSSDITSKANILSGGAWVVSGGTPATSSNGLKAVPEGTTVYMQWMDKDGAVSPIYSTKTHNNVDVQADGDPTGSYAFDLTKGWVDNAGKTHLYNATSGQYFRVWVEDYQQDGLNVSMIRQSGGFFPGSFVNSVTNSNLGQFPLIGTNMQRTGVFMQQDPSAALTRPENEWTDGSFAGDLSLNRAISGRVWLETGQLDYANSATGPNQGTNEPGAENYKVVFSSLTNEGVQAYEAKVNSLPKPERAAAAQQLFKDHPEYISATVTTKTDANGDYKLQFPEGTYQHRYLYGFVQDPQGDIVTAYSTYVTPEYQRPNRLGSWTPQAIPSPLLNAWFNVNFAVVDVPKLELNIANFDMIDNPANPGETADLVLSGSKLSPLPKKIVWTDKNGKVVKTCDPIETFEQGSACDFDVPADAPDGMIYTATLYVADNPIAKDSFIVQTKADLTYPPADTPAGQPVTTDAPTISNNVTKPADGKFIFDENKLPGGWVVDPKDPNKVVNDGGTPDNPNDDITATIDPDTGKVTVNPGPDAPLNQDGTPEVKLPVVLVDGANKPIATGDVTVDLTEKPDAPVEKDNDKFQPDYEDGSGKPGTDVTVPAPKFTDKDGNDTKAPEGTKFTPGDNAPDGVKVDESTGVVTVPVPADAKPGDKITVPVVVTYPDGTTDTVDVTVTVEEPDAPAPGVVDYRPAYGDPVVVPAGESKTSDIAYPDGQTPPAGTRYELDPNYTVPAGWTVKVDETTGQVTATAAPAGPDGANQEELVVPVRVIYPDGTSTGNDVANAVFQLDTDGDGTPDLTDTDDDGDGIPDAEEIEKGSDPKDPNSKPQTPLSDFQPSYPEATVPAGGKVTSDVTFEGEPKPEGTKFEIDPNFKVPNGWTVTVDPETGAVTAEAAPAGPNGADQEQIIVPVVITYPDGTATHNDVANAVFNLDTDGDGTPDSKDDDDDGDGIPDAEEIEKGSDPKDPNSKPSDQTPKPDWNDGSGKPGESVTLPNNGGTVPDGAKVETDGPGKATIDDNGNIVVDINDDAKPGDKITVVVTDKDGNKIDEVTVTVGDPDVPAEKPDWNDGSGKPGETVTLPNNGGTVPDGAKVDTSGPGKATIGDDGSIKVDINDDAKPGDKITVVVTDKDGNKIDEVTVTVGDPEAPGGDGSDGTGSLPGSDGSGSLPGSDGSGSTGSSDGLIPGLIGGGIIGGLIGGSLGNHGDHGSSMPGKPGDSKPGKPGAGDSKPGKPGAGDSKPGKPGAGDQGGNTGKPGTGNAGDNGAANQGGNAGTGTTGGANTGDNGAADQGNRGGQLAMTGVSGVAVTLGAAVLALVAGGALLALRRRRES